MSLHDYIPLYRELFEDAEQKIAGVMSPEMLKMLLIGGGGVAAGAIPAGLIMHHLDEAKREKTRNRAFGAGVATGFAGPHILKGLFNVAKRTGMMPQEAAPMLQQEYAGNA